MKSSLSVHVAQSLGMKCYMHWNACAQKYDYLVDSSCQQTSWNRNSWRDSNCPRNAIGLKGMSTANYTPSPWLANMAEGPRNTHPPWESHCRYVYIQAVCIIHKLVVTDWTRKGLSNTPDSQDELLLTPTAFLTSPNADCCPVTIWMFPACSATLDLK